MVLDTWLQDPNMLMDLNLLIEDDSRFVDSSLVNAAEIGEDSKKESSRIGCFRMTNAATLVYILNLLYVFICQQVKRTHTQTKSNKMIFLAFL